MLPTNHATTLSSHCRFPHYSSVQLVALPNFILPGVKVCKKKRRGPDFEGGWETVSALGFAGAITVGIDHRLFSATFLLWLPHIIRLSAADIVPVEIVPRTPAI